MCQNNQSCPKCGSDSSKAIAYYYSHDQRYAFKKDYYKVECYQCGFLVRIPKTWRKMADRKSYEDSRRVLMTYWNKCVEKKLLEKFVSDCVPSCIC